MYLADKAKEVRGIDVNVDGINDAKEFAKINKIDNIKFYNGNILPHLNQFEKESLFINLNCNPIGVFLYPQTTSAEQLLFHKLYQPLG